MEAESALPGRSTAEVLSLWRASEARFEANKYYGEGSRDQIIHRPSRNGILLVAAHSTNHRRELEEKPADRGTGGLVETTADITGAGVLAMCGPQTGDANWDTQHPLKAAIEKCRQHTRMVLDIHGMTDLAGPDICMGTGQLHEPNAEQTARHGLHLAETLGLTATVDALFDASRAGTIVNYCFTLGLPALQIEFAARRRDLFAEESAVLTVRWLSEVILWLVNRD